MNQNSNEKVELSVLMKLDSTDSYFQGLKRFWSNWKRTGLVQEWSGQIPQFCLQNFNFVGLCCSEQSVRQVQNLAVCILGSICSVKKKFSPFKTAEHILSEKLNHRLCQKYNGIQIVV